VTDEGATSPDAPKAPEEPADAPAAPASPAPAAPAPASTWTPPDTFSDRFSRWSTAAVRYSVAALGLVSLVVWILWLVPTIAVSTSASYRTACERVAGERTLTDYVGAPIVCERVPTWYRVDTPEGDLFRLEARGRDGGVLAEVRVKEGKADIVGFYISQ
jgi:hypothetical protein